MFEATMVESMRSTAPVIPISLSIPCATPTMHSLTRSRPVSASCSTQARRNLCRCLVDSGGP